MKSTKIILKVLLVTILVLLLVNATTSALGVAPPPSDPPNQAPRAVISSPRSGTNGIEGDLIIFDGRASYDPEGSSLTFCWISSIEGVLSTSSYFLDTLSVGSHTITLRVRDSSGIYGYSSVWINMQGSIVYPPSPPDPSEWQLVTTRTISCTGTVDPYPYMYMKAQNTYKLYYRFIDNLDQWKIENDCYGESNIAGFTNAFLPGWENSEIDTISDMWTDQGSSNVDYLWLTGGYGMQIYYSPPVEIENPGHISFRFTVTTHKFSPGSKVGTLLDWKWQHHSWAFDGLTGNEDSPWVWSYISLEKP